MPRPQLSVVMPMREADARPMLDSLLALPIEMQIICVDDCSSDDTAAKVEGWSGATGRPVEILRNESRLYSYGSRLRGMARAAAPVVWNVDADDRIPDPLQAGRAFAAMRARMPDIMHCRAVGLQGDDPLCKPLPWTEPVAPELSGAGIFDSFMRAAYPPAILWNKLYSARLCEAIVAEAPRIEVRYFDVKFLGMLSILLARSYIGGNELIYEYRMRATRPAWLYSRQVKSLLLLESVMLPLVERLAPLGADAFKRYCHRRLVVQAGHLAIMSEAETAGMSMEVRQRWLEERILPNISLQELVHALSVSLAANKSRIGALIGLLSGRPARKVKPCEAEAAPEAALRLLRKNAALARRLTQALAPEIDITKKAN